jgi:hypothetical protein
MDKLSPTNLKLKVAEGNEVGVVKTRQIFIVESF